MMIAAQLAVSAPTAEPFQPKAELRKLQLIPYTEAEHWRIIQSHNWFGGLILVETEIKFN